MYLYRSVVLQFIEDLIFKSGIIKGSCNWFFVWILYGYGLFNLCQEKSSLLEFHKVIGRFRQKLIDLLEKKEQELDLRLKANSILQIV